MLARALLIVAALIGLYLLFRWLRRSPWRLWAGRAAITVGVTGFLLLLTVRGGAEVALPLLVGLAPLLIRWLNARRPSFPSDTDAPSESTVTTRFLNMTLEHRTGAMQGQILEGRFTGRSLGELSLQELLALRQECLTDPQSQAVLETYLDRHAKPGWRDEEQHHDSQTRSNAASAAMSHAEALQILGIAPDATRQEIEAAYRRLMQKLHPDHGGSAYLAAQLNRARDVLLRS